MMDFLRFTFEDPARFVGMCILLIVVGCMAELVIVACGNALGGAVKAWRKP